MERPDLTRPHLLCSRGEGHGGEGRRQSLSVHLAPSALQVIVLPGAHVRALQRNFNEMSAWDRYLARLVINRPSWTHPTNQGM